MTPPDAPLVKSADRVASVTYISLLNDQLLFLSIFDFEFQNKQFSKTNIQMKYKQFKKIKI